VNINSCGTDVWDIKEKRRKRAHYIKITDYAPCVSDVECQHFLSDENSVCWTSLTLIMKDLHSVVLQLVFARCCVTVGICTVLCYIWCLHSVVLQLVFAQCCLTVGICTVLCYSWYLHRIVLHLVFAQCCVTVGICTVLCYIWYLHSVVLQLVFAQCCVTVDICTVLCYSWYLDRVVLHLVFAQCCVTVDICTVFCYIWYLHSVVLQLAFLGFLSDVLLSSIPKRSCRKLDLFSLQRWKREEIPADVDRWKQLVLTTRSSFDGVCCIGSIDCFVRVLAV